MKLSVSCFFPVTASLSPRYSPLSQQQQQSTLARRTAAKVQRSLTSIIGHDDVQVPHGHIPIYVGEEMKRFVISAALLKVPVIKQLLDMSAQEYGYNQQGAVHVSCDVLEFERVLEAARRDMVWIQQKKKKIFIKRGLDDVVLFSLASAFL